MSRNLSENLSLQKWQGFQLAKQYIALGNNMFQNTYIS